VLERCLEKSPEERFQSARDLAFDLGLLSSVSGLERVPEARAMWRPWRRAFVLASSAAVVAGLLVLGVAIGRHTARQSVPSFSRLTFRQGHVGAARFAPDGETLVYGARWEDGTPRLFLKRPDAPEALPLELPGVATLAVSRQGEVALVLRPGFAFGSWSPGLLARAPLSGGAPREVASSVLWAEWTPDGSQLAIVRSEGGRRRLEFPPGKALYETAGGITSPRFSPDGALIAFADHPIASDDRGSIAVVDRSGKARKLTSDWSSIQGVAWSSGGDEIWFAAATMGIARSLYGVTLRGRVRDVLKVPGELTLFDVSRAGHVVVAREEGRFGILVGGAGEAKERDLTWLGGSFPADISPDGKVLLFMEQTMLAEYAVCLRRTEGSPPVVLGKGEAMALSPDGAWALASLPSPEAPLLLLPTGPGEPKEIKLPGISHRGAVFFPDGRSILVQGHAPGRDWRLYQIGIEGGTARPVTPEGVFSGIWTNFAISPDGMWVAARAEGPSVWLYPIAGGERRKLPCDLQSPLPIRWSADGKALFIAERSELARIVRVDVATGQLTVVKDLTPADPLARPFPYVTITPDGSTYAYAYSRHLSELYLVEGLR
jgi:Tol biopolymer transport system component